MDNNDKMIAISNSDFKKYGCPKCGHRISDIKMNRFMPIICTECEEMFVVLVDGVKATPISFGGDDAYYPQLIEHPKKNK